LGASTLHELRLEFGGYQEGVDSSILTLGSWGKGWCEEERVGLCQVTWTSLLSSLDLSFSMWEMERSSCQPHRVVVKIKWGEGWESTLRTVEKQMFLSQHLL
jgi:hypothetical protein